VTDDLDRTAWPETDGRPLLLVPVGSVEQHGPALPLTTEMFYQLSQIGTRTFQLFPVFVAATLYYLIATSVLMVGQAYLERRFGRGFGTKVKSDKEKAVIGLQAGGAK